MAASNAAASEAESQSIGNAMQAQASANETTGIISGIGGLGSVITSVAKLF